MSELEWLVLASSPCLTGGVIAEQFCAYRVGAGGVGVGVSTSPGRADPLAGAAACSR